MSSGCLVAPPDTAPNCKPYRRKSKSSSALTSCGMAFPIRELCEVRVAIRRRSSPLSVIGTHSLSPIFGESVESTRAKLRGEGDRPMSRVAILGAAGRDFHNFHVFFRSNH